MKKAFVLMFCALLAACGAHVARTDNQASPGNAGAVQSNADQPAQTAKESGDKAPTPERRTDGPRTVRDFFALLPEKYFTLEGCDRATDKNCDRARAAYLKTFLEVEDTQNGYLKAACDGAQSCLTMALFKRPDGSYLVGVNTAHEAGENYYFLDYADGKWTDLSAEVVPEYSPRKMYELPRYGTIVKVFAKKIIEEGPDFIASEKGAFLYDLEWKNGKFAIRR